MRDLNLKISKSRPKEFFKILMSIPLKNSEVLIESDSRSLSCHLVDEQSLNEQSRQEQRENLKENKVLEVKPSLQALKCPINFNFHLHEEVDINIIVLLKFGLLTICYSLRLQAILILRQTGKIRYQVEQLNLILEATFKFLFLGTEVLVDFWWRIWRQCTSQSDTQANTTDDLINHQQYMRLKTIAVSKKQGSPGFKKTAVDEKKKQKAAEKQKQVSKLMEIIEDSDEMAQQLFEISVDDAEDSEQQKQGKVKFNDEVVVLYDPDKKWSTPIKNEKKGKFSPEEREALEQSMDKYCSLHDITKDELKRRVTEGQTSQKNKKMWVTICAVLPNRSIASCFRFLQRQLNDKNRQGKWTPEETEQLRRLYDQFGNTRYQWKTIAQRLNRTAENVRDKYYSMMSETPQLPFWSMCQTIELIKHIQNQIQVKISSHNGLKTLKKEAATHDKIQGEERGRRSYNSPNFTFHNLKTLCQQLKYDVIKDIDFDGIKWRSIAQEIKTKSKDQCRFRWRQIIAYQHNTFRPSSLKQDIELIREIESQNPYQQSDIDFKIDNGRTQQENKQRWLVLKKFVSGRTEKSFKDILKDVVQHIKHPRLQHG